MTDSRVDSDGGDYGDRIGPQGKHHYPHFTRGCYYGPAPGRDGPCWRCQLGTLGWLFAAILKRAVRP